MTGEQERQKEGADVSQPWVAESLLRGHAALRLSHYGVTDKVLGRLGNIGPDWLGQG